MLPLTAVLLGSSQGLSWVSSNVDEPDQLLLCTEITLRSRACAVPLLTLAPALRSAVAERLMITPAAWAPAPALPRPERVLEAEKLEDAAAGPPGAAGPRRLPQD